MDFKNLRAQYNQVKEQMNNSILSVLEKGDYIQGTEVFKLEKELCSKIGTKFCITCANGTEAIMLILMAYGIGIGDAVFIPDITFIATANAAKLLGASVVFVDINTITYNIDAHALAKQIEFVKEEGKLIPKAIIAVDMNGLPADYYQIQRIANKYNLILIEDAAQSIGGRINSTMAGNFGNAAATSFYPAKPLGCYGDGGAVFCNDDNLAERINSIKLHGRSKIDKYRNVELGINSRLDTIQAAILLVKIPLLFDFELNRIREIAKAYSDNLCAHITTPIIPDGFFSTYTYYSIVVESENVRDSLQEHLLKNNINTQIYYPNPLHKQPVYLNGNIDDDFLYAKSIYYSKHTFALPIHAYLSDSDVDFIIQTTNNFYR